MQIKSLSMSTIKDWGSVPQYLMDKMAGIAWDDWIGDSDDGTKCEKYACKYGVAKTWFYFVFSRSPCSTTGETPESENYLFCGLAAHQPKESKWFERKFNPTDFEQVKLIVDTQDDNATSYLELESTSNTNPLNLA